MIKRNVQAVGLVHQVCPLNQPLSFKRPNKKLKLKDTVRCSSGWFIDLPGWQINEPLEGIFELTLRPSRALDSPHASLPELQRNKDTVRGAGPTPSTATDANLDFAFVEKALVYTDP